MVNPSRDIGTRGETAVARYLNANGFGGAEIRRTRGTKDLGDITGCGPLVIEIKSGEKARNASDGQIDRWLVETETERTNAGADLGLLVVARHRKGVAHWWCCMTMATHQTLLEGRIIWQEPLASLQCRVTLETAVLLLRSRGWGDAL